MQSGRGVDAKGGVASTRVWPRRGWWPRRGCALRLSLDQNLEGWTTFYLSKRSEKRACFPLIKLPTFKGKGAPKT